MAGVACAPWYINPMTGKRQNRPDLRDLRADQVQDLVVELGEKPFRARQVLRWLYKHGAHDFASMSDLSKDLRGRLERVSSLTWLEPAKLEKSSDGAVKMLLPLEDGALVECVLIPEEDHSTLCVSTQVGCRQGCRFCATASLGFSRNLRPAEIMAQVLLAREMAGGDKPLTNLVFMGMGEPLDNLDALLIALDHILGEHGLQMSQRKVTVSTVGLVDKLPLLAAASPAALAVSLNAPNDQIRSSIMPVNRRWPMAELKKALMAYPLKPTRRITLEYVLLAGVNDQPQHARELAQWVRGLRCKVNLIAHNPHAESPFEPPKEQDVLAFQDALIADHITALIRRPRGRDISAACGTLAAKA